MELVNYWANFNPSCHLKPYISQYCSAVKEKAITQSSRKKGVQKLLDNFDS
jgi:hypothetical protein